MTSTPIARVIDVVSRPKTWNPAQTAPHEYFDYLDLSSVDQFEKRIVEARRTVRKDAPSRARQLVEAGDILVSTVRPNLNGVALVPAELHGATASTGFCVLRPKAELVDNRYLFHWVKTPAFVEEMTRRATGASYPAVSDRIVLESSMVLPSVGEQRLIAEVLDRAEALRTKRRATLAQLDTLTQSIFLDLFGDPVTNPRKWPTTTLKDFFRFRTGKLDSNAATPSGEYPFFTCSRDDLRIDTHAFDCEALLLAGNNASGDYSVKHYRGKFNAYQRTYVITLSDETNSYAYARLVLEYMLAQLKRISKGTSTKYLTMELLNAIGIAEPPRELQAEFARRIAVVEKLRLAQRASLAELDALFASLQHRAFRGEL